MKIRTLFFLLVFLLSVSCEAKINEIPETSNIIPADSMAIILEEVMIIEDNIQMKYPHISQFQEVIKNSGDTILKNHGLTFSRFEESINYYGSHQDMMKSIYNQILESMNKKILKLETEK